MGDERGGDDVSGSFRIPARTVFLAISCVLFGGAGVGTLAPLGVEKAAIRNCMDSASEANKKSDTAVGIAENAADLVRTLSHVVERHGNTVADEGARITNSYTALEALRINMVEWKHTSVTQKEAAKMARALDRFERNLDALERDIKQLQGWHGK